MKCNTDFCRLQAGNLEWVTPNPRYNDGLLLCYRNLPYTCGLACTGFVACAAMFVMIVIQTDSTGVTSMYVHIRHFQWILFI